MVFVSKCPNCGTEGRIWNKEPEVFRCPNCSSVFSRFGIVVEPENDQLMHWN